MIPDEIAKIAEDQISKKIKDVNQVWLDALTTKISELHLEELDSLSNVLSKDRVSGISGHIFALLLERIATNNKLDALNLYLEIKGRESVDLLIDEMNKGTLDVILAKRRMDQIWEDAETLIKSISITAAKTLLPILLGLL